MNTAIDPNATSVRSSDLSRASADVFAVAERHPVQVTRRDGEDLVLMSRREDDARRQLLEVAAQIIAATTSTEGTLAERMAVPFPWMLALSPQDRDACAVELVDAARASFATSQPHLALSEIAAWFETATAIAAGLRQQGTDWLDESERVERP